MPSFKSFHQCIVMAFAAYKILIRIVEHGVDGLTKITSHRLPDGGAPFRYQILTQIGYPYRQLHPVFLYGD